MLQIQNQFRHSPTPKGVPNPRPNKSLVVIIITKPASSQPKKGILTNFQVRTDLSLSTICNPLARRLSPACELDQKSGLPDWSPQRRRTQSELLRISQNTRRPWMPKGSAFSCPRLPDPDLSDLSDLTESFCYPIARSRRGQKPGACSAQLTAHPSAIDLQSMYLYGEIHACIYKYKL